jgi:2-methylfumaryl-CoA hydratase
MNKRFRYGRFLEEFHDGDVYEHPWDVTVDAGHVAVFQSAFLDATPTYASTRYARELGFRDQPVHPLLLLNFALSFSVHDVSEQAIAHLAYLNVRFPDAAFAGDTLTAYSRVIGSKKASSGDRGVVHVETGLETDGGKTVCLFERKALVRALPTGAGASELTRPEALHASGTARPAVLGALAHDCPPEIRDVRMVPLRKAGFAGFADEFTVGDVILPDFGKTVSDAEHMGMTALVRNSHPLHFDEQFSRNGGSFSGKRVVYGGLVFAWVAALASRDIAGQALWDLSFDNGAHPNGVGAGDTLYAAAKVLAKEPHGPNAQIVKFRLVGTKNVKPAELLADPRGADLFEAELGKKEPARKIDAKVFEIDRTLLIRNRPA